MSWTSSAARRGRDGSRDAARDCKLGEAVLVVDDLGGTGGGRGEIAEPARAQLQGEVEGLGAAAAAGAFGFVADVLGAAFDAGFGFFVEQLAGGRFGLLAYGLGGFE